MHAADKNTNRVQHHKTHVDRRARGRANSKPHTHTMRQNVERRNLRHECRDPNTMLQHETRHADKRVHECTSNEGHQEQDRNMTAQEHDYTRLTHNNRQDKKKQNTETKRGGREGSQASASRRAQKVTSWDQGGAGGLSQGGSGSPGVPAGGQGGAGGTKQGGSGSPT